MKTIAMKDNDGYDCNVIIPDSVAARILTTDAVGSDFDLGEWKGSRQDKATFILTRDNELAGVQQRTRHFPLNYVELCRQIS